MKKAFRYYSIVWAILFVLFNVIAFASVGSVGQEKYTASFWIGYIFITVSFIGQLVCAYFAFKDSDIKKLFYNLSLVTTSYTGLILSFVFGGLCMLISPLPYWVGIILCVIVLAVNAIAVVKASAAIEIVSAIDNKIKTQTLFIKSLTVDAESLMARAKSDAVKAECKKVYEAVRYSDPMSNDVLTMVEGQISVKFAELSDAVKVDDITSITEIANDIVILINNRNQKCKASKQ